MDIAIKLGFKHLMVHKQFLGANIDASFNWLNLQGLVETGALASSEGINSSVRETTVFRILFSDIIPGN